MTKLDRIQTVANILLLCEIYRLIRWAFRRATRKPIILKDLPEFNDSEDRKI